MKLNINWPKSDVSFAVPLTGNEIQVLTRKKIMTYPRTNPNDDYKRGYRAGYEAGRRKKKNA
jgi:hypothetical protein